MRSKFAKNLKIVNLQDSCNERLEVFMSSGFKSRDRNK